MQPANRLPDLRSRRHSTHCPMPLLNQDGKFPSSLRRGKGVVSGVIIWPHGKSLNRTRSETEPLHLSKAGNSPLGVKEGYVGKVSQRSHSSPSDLSPLLCWSRYGHCQESSAPYTPFRPLSPAPSGAAGRLPSQRPQSHRPPHRPRQSPFLPERPQARALCPPPDSHPGAGRRAPATTSLLGDSQPHQPPLPGGLAARAADGGAAGTPGVVLRLEGPGASEANRGCY